MLFNAPVVLVTAVVAGHTATVMAATAEVAYQVWSVCEADKDATTIQTPLFITLTNLEGSNQGPCVLSCGLAKLLGFIFRW